VNARNSAYNDAYQVDASYTPSLPKARALVGTARFVPMYREILADLETPVSAYLKYAAEIGRASCRERV